MYHPLNYFDQLTRYRWCSSAEKKSKEKDHLWECFLILFLLEGRLKTWNRICTLSTDPDPDP
jgi:hypothetical protein